MILYLVVPFAILSSVSHRLPAYFPFLTKLSTSIYPPSSPAQLLLLPFPPACCSFLNQWLSEHHFLDFSMPQGDILIPALLFFHLISSLLSESPRQHVRWQRSPWRLRWGWELFSECGLCVHVCKRLCLREVQWMTVEGILQTPLIQKTGPEVQRDPNPFLHMTTGDIISSSLGSEL